MNQDCFRKRLSDLRDCAEIVGSPTWRPDRATSPPASRSKPNGASNTCRVAVTQRAPDAQGKPGRRHGKSKSKSKSKSMSQERDCDCADRHRVLTDHPLGGTQIAPATHQHEDARCSKALGIGGCPGLPHCRDWVVGSYRAGETLAEVQGEKQRAFEIRIQREDLEHEFARRPPQLRAPPVPPRGNAV